MQKRLNHVIDTSCAGTNIKDAEDAIVDTSRCEYVSVVAARLNRNSVHTFSILRKTMQQLAPVEH